MASTTSAPGPTRSVLGSLTTPFAAPTKCDQVVQDCSSCPGFRGQACGTNTWHVGGMGLQDDPDCWPQRNGIGVDNLPTPAQFKGWGFYSPGVVCPMGMTTACSMSHDADTRTLSFAFQFLLTKSETAAGCCPIGYKCTLVQDPDAPKTSPKLWQTCIKVATPGDSFPTAQCLSQSRFSFGTLALPATVRVTTTATSGTTATGTLTTSTALSQVTLWAPLIQINWQATDRPTTEANNTAGPTDTATPPPADQSSQPPAGLTTAATAGVAVSVVVIGLLILGLGVWMFIKRRRESRAATQPMAEQHREELEGSTPSGGPSYGYGGEHAGAYNSQNGKSAAAPDGAMYELPPASSIGDYVSSVTSGSVGFSSPSPGTATRSSCFQAQGIMSYYDEQKAELESPPVIYEMPTRPGEASMLHEMPTLTKETSKDRAEMSS